MTIPSGCKPTISGMCNDCGRLQCTFLEEGTKNEIKPLLRIQNQAVNKIAGAFKTTPIAALEAELAITPVKIRLNHQ